MNTSTHLHRTLIHNGPQHRLTLESMEATEIVCKLEGVYRFASAAEDGSLHVISVHVNQSGSLPKYGKLQTIREYRVDSPGEYITCMIQYNSDVASNLVFATTHSVITILDLRTMRVLQHTKPASFWTYHLHVSGPQTHVDSRGHFYGCALTLGPTFWLASQELGKGVG
ncbi:hypothetical protein EV702DRAFT_516334 [Suillus placidus]|uniref:Uncharacterized protein n=1 Tax=Suillus placidus TaxID=48579 RepID=A0A9P6ZPW7_9AGAM|nr:hypothetical protein EV702DRAFT_516334 [Suillus placidus]